MPGYFNMLLDGCWHTESPIMSKNREVVLALVKWCCLALCSFSHIQRDPGTYMETIWYRIILSLGIIILSYNCHVRNFMLGLPLYYVKEFEVTDLMVSLTALCFGLTSW